MEGNDGVEDDLNVRLQWPEGDHADNEPAATRSPSGATSALIDLPEARVSDYSASEIGRLLDGAEDNVRRLDRAVQRLQARMDSTASAVKVLAGALSELTDDDQRLMTFRAAVKVFVGQVEGAL